MTIVCFEAHAKDGRVWAIRHRGRWLRTAYVSVEAPTETVYRGKDARQPKAFLQCRGPVVVTRSKQAVAIRKANNARAADGD